MRVLGRMKPAFVVALGTLGGCDLGNSEEPVTPVEPMGAPVDPGTGAGGSGGTSGFTSPPPAVLPNGESCHNLQATSAPIIMDEMGSSLPSLSGGTLADGTYQLVKYEWYDSKARLHQRRIVIEISNAGRRLGYLWQRDQDPEERVLANVTTEGARITLRGVCPSGDDLEWDRYSVTGSGLVLFSTRDSKAATFARR